MNMLNSYEVRTESRVNFIGAGWYGHKKKHPLKIKS